MDDVQIKEIVRAPLWRHRGGQRDKLLCAASLILLRP